MDITPYIGTIVTVIIAMGGVYAAISAKLAKTETRLDNIEHKIDVHNGYAEKFAEVAVQLAEISTELKAIKERLEK